MAEVLLIVGSKSDLDKVKPAVEVLSELGISYEIKVSSAHRNPDETIKIAKEAESQGVKVIIAGAGLAAHLPGFIASQTKLPVIGVPIDTPPLQGVDSLLSIVQMPKGVPVACMSIGKNGFHNAALFAAKILALTKEYHR